MNFDITKLIITPQEKQIIFEIRKLNIPYTIQPLTIGDIQIYKKNVPEIIIERKSKNDLKASIHSNRYKDQKYRMLDTGIQRHNIIYLIEDMKGNEANVWGAICNTLYRDQISVFKTKSPHESALFLQYLMKSVEKNNCYKCNSINNGEQEEYKEIMIDQKKKSIDNTNWFMTSLSLIKGVSKQIAEKIVEEYANYEKLNKAYNENGEYALCNLQIGKRKLGKVLSQRIYDTIKYE